MSEVLRILLVEDQEADVILMQRELRRQGLTFTAQRVDRDEAMIRALHEFAPDLVIADVSLPGFSGLEALAILRKERPGVPLIFVSGTIDEEQAVEMLKLGGTGYVLKENLSQLPGAISRALEQMRIERDCGRAEAHHREEIGKMPTPTMPARRTEGAGQMSASVVHDLNNILAPISMAVSMLRGKLPDAERDRMCSIIENSARAASEIVRAALAPDRVETGKRRPLEMGRVIKEVFQRLLKAWPETLQVKFAVEDDLWRVTGNATQIEGAIFELCARVGNAMPGGGTLRLSLRNQQVEASDAHLLPTMKPGPFVVLEISETSDRPPPGIAAGTAEPFRTPQPAGTGSGPGLTAMESIVKQHGGFVATVRVPGEGMRCKIALPATRDEEPRAGGEVPAVAPRAGNGECILLVDDEETIRFAARSVLTKHGYRVLTATDGAEALRVFNAHADKVALVLTDLMMPVMDGMTLVRTLRQIRPGLRVIVSSGQNEKTRLAELQGAGISAVLNKPYAAEILLRTVEDALNQRDPATTENDFEPLRRQ